MSNRVPSWFAQSAAACVLSGESLFGSAYIIRRRSETKQGERTQQEAGSARDGWVPSIEQKKVRSRSVTSEQALDGEEDGAHVVGGGPLVLEDVEADVAVRPCASTLGWKQGVSNRTWGGL